MRHGFDCSQSFEPATVFAKIDGATSSRCEPLSAERTTDGSDSLRRLIPSARFFAGRDITFDSIADPASSDWAGKLVVYRIGQHCPMQLVAEAMARGAAGILTEQVLPCPLPQCVVGDVELAIAEIRAHQLHRPDRKLLTVGVIGSAGKTSTTLLISSLLRGSGFRTAYACDLGESDGVLQTTTDQPLASGARLIEHLADSSDAGSKAAIVELSETEARHGHYDSMQFDILVVTGRATCSGDFGPSGLQCLLERVTTDGVVIAPSEDAKACRVIRDHDCHLLTYGVGQRGDVSVTMVEQSGGISTMLLNHRDTTSVMETALCGEAMAANHAAAAMVGLLIDLPLETITERLGSLREIPGRGQRIAEFDRPAVVVDAGGSPERVLASLRTCRSMQSRGKLWCVLAIDEVTEPESMARYGTIMERFADHAIVTSRKECQKSFLNRSHNVLDGVKQCAAFRLVANQRRAVQWAMEQASPADTIVLITGQNGQTAKQQRIEIETLKRWLDPPKLKVFTG